MPALKSNPLVEWLDRATAEQRKAFASAAGTTPAALHQASKAYRTGGELRITPEFAGRLEHASLQFPIVPHLRREDLSPACSRCDLAKRCRSADIKD